MGERAAPPSHQLSHIIINMTDYLSLKKSIFSKYLSDVPKVTGIMPTAFLISDLYHFMKGHNGGMLPPQKMQTIVRAWVSDPTSNAIPINVIQGFTGSSYFGACNNEWLQTTQEEFIITPMRSWYDSGKLGLKWQDGEVTLQGVTNDPMAQQLFEDYKKMNEGMFAQIKAKGVTTNRTPHGAIEPGVIMSVLGNVYDPFVEEVTTVGRSECNTISCGYANLHALEPIEENKVANYIDEILETNKNNKQTFIVGGGQYGNSKTVALYKTLYNFERKLIEYSLKQSAKFEDWKNVFDSLMEFLYIKLDTLANAVQTLKYILYGDAGKEFIYAISFVYNRISGTTDSRFKNNTEMNKYATNAIEQLIKKSEENSDVVKTIANVNNEIKSTIYYDILIEGAVKISKLTFDLPRAKNNAENITKVEITDSDSLIVNSEWNYVNRVSTYELTNTSTSNEINFDLFLSKDERYVFVSALNFMRQWYEHKAKSIDDEVARNNFHTAVMCIAYSFDFFIIDINTCAFYGVQLI
jgi:hypothetical protein